MEIEMHICSFQNPFSLFCLFLTECLRIPFLFTVTASFIREKPIRTSAKLIKIQQKSLQRRHGLHELGSHMESNHTLHGSELGPHWVLGPKNSKFGPMGPKKFAQKFLYAKLVRYHEVILWSCEAKIVFGAKQFGKIQIPDFTLSVGQKNQIDFVWSKSSLH